MNDQIEKRLDAVERTVQEEAELRAKVDKDLSDVQSGQRGLARVVQAIRETQVEQGSELTRHTGLLKSHTKQLVELKWEVLQQRRTLEGIEGKFFALDGKVSGLDGKVSELGGKIDRVLELLDPPPAPEPVAAD